MRHSQSSTPSTPTHHRRGQSLSAINAPRTPSHLSLRPPVYLQSPMAQSPMAQSPMGANHHSNGLMGVGDVFNPPSGSFHDNMRRSSTPSATVLPNMLTWSQPTTHPSYPHPAPPSTTSTRKSQTSTCRVSDPNCLVMLCSSLRCPRRVKHPHSHSTLTTLSPRRPSRSFQQGQHHRWRTACRYKIQTQATWSPSSGRLNHHPLVIHFGTRSSRMANLRQPTTSTRCESPSCRPGSPLLRATVSWSLICERPRLLPRATASPIPAAALWATHFVVPQISAHSSLLEALSHPLAADRARRAGECAPTSEHSPL